MGTWVPPIISTTQLPSQRNNAKRGTQNNNAKGATHARKQLNRWPENRRSIYQRSMMTLGLEAPMAKPVRVLLSLVLSLYR